MKKNECRFHMSVCSGERRNESAVLSKQVLVDYEGETGLKPERKMRKISSVFVEITKIE